jgi:hypothetical protein
MAQAMRGADCTHQDSGPFAVGPCHCERVGDTGEHAADCAGKWLRATNRQSGVALYVHTITHEVRVRDAGPMERQISRHSSILHT